MFKIMVLLKSTVNSLLTTGSISSFILMLCKPFHIKIYPLNLCPLTFLSAKNYCIKNVTIRLNIFKMLATELNMQQVS